MVVSRTDVAKAARVSPAVVSYVLNDGPRGVAPDTRKRVLEAVERLGYRPNRIAASLRRKQTMSLGLIVPDNLNPYFAELAREIEMSAFGRGYTLLMGNAMEQLGRETTYVREFLDRRVDGVLLIPSGTAVPALEELTAAQIPFVILDRAIQSPLSRMQVLSDNVSGGRLAVTHLLEHDRRRIACVAGPPGMINAVERVQGWRSALDDESRVMRGALREVPISRFDGRRAALEMLREDSLVDAVFVASDEQAIGVLRAVRELGLSCPKDVAIVSFDGTSHAALTTPGLTTVRQPMTSMAERALELLLSQYAGAAPIVDRLPVELVQRGSCGCLDAFEPDDQYANSPTPEELQ